MGGILGWYWHSRQSFGTDEWTVAVFWDDYKLLFHHLPPALLEPQELPSCSPGSVRAVALQEEACKMLQMNSGACGPARLLVRQPAVSGGEGDFINLSSLNGFVTLMTFQMETIVSVLGSIRKGDWMFSIDLKDTYFQISAHPESQLYHRFCFEGRVYQFRVLCFGLSTAPQVFTRIFAWVSELAHQRGVCRV